MPDTICQVLHSLNVGGAEMLAYRLAQQLRESFRFVFACLDEIGPLGAELQRQGFAIELLGRRPGLDLRCAGRLAAFCRRENVAVLHAHQYTPFAYSLLSGLGRHRPPILFNEHGRFFPDRRNAKRVWFNRLMLRRRDRVAAVGSSVRTALIQNEGIAAARIAVIYNGVSLPKTPPDAGLRDAVRAEWGVPADAFVMLQVARLDVIKDHPTAIRTLTRVVATRPQVRLLIVGDGPERHTIEQEIQRQQMVDRVRMLGERRDVARLLQGADAFLLTSVSEGIPVTLIEAMGASLPVVATSVGGVAEVVEHGRTGLLAPAGADEELARHVLRLVDDPRQRAEMGRAGRSRSEALFTEEKMHAAYAALYAEMTSRF